MVPCNVLSCWTQLVSVFFWGGEGGGVKFSRIVIYRSKISKNGLHLKLKLHPLWRTTLWLKIQTKNYFGFKHASSKVHFRSTGGQTFYWSIMTADDSIKCRCANSGMTGQVGCFQNPGVCLQAFPSFLPHPTRSFTCAIFRAVFDSRSSFFAPKPHRNACYAG